MEGAIPLAQEFYEWRQQCPCKCIEIDVDIYRAKTKSQLYVFFPDFAVEKWFLDGEQRTMHQKLPPGKRASDGVDFFAGYAVAGVST